MGRPKIPKVPKDAALLRKMYWDDNMTLPEIGTVFGVSHKSVERAMRRLNIPRRTVGTSRHAFCIEPGCHAPVYKVLHIVNGARYGRRCYQHWKAFRGATCANWWRTKGSNYKLGLLCPLCGGPKSDFSLSDSSICRQCWCAKGRERKELLRDIKQYNAQRREERQWIRQAKTNLKMVKSLLQAKNSDVANS